MSYSRLIKSADSLQVPRMSDWNTSVEKNGGNNVPMSSKRAGTHLPSPGTWVNTLHLNPHPGKLREDLPFTPTTTIGSMNLRADNKSDHNLIPDPDNGLSDQPQFGTSISRGLDGKAFGKPVMGIYDRKNRTITIQSGRSTYKIRFDDCDITGHGPVPSSEDEDIIVNFRYVNTFVLHCAVPVPYSVARSRLAKLGLLPFPVPRQPERVKTPERDSNLNWFHEQHFA
ncbi:uncharacterized protein BJX67DRAFT_359499 [Aspergillus lucknowensis]|uniref:Uncharacterized protein n=1 Tax=Aspergillus lucknowensis TaxID=176173 RepID=A0ABR4LK97_9EURO